MRRKGHLSPARAHQFKIISILLPFLFLFLLEVGLRLFHYGNDLSLFIEDPANKDYYILNPAASKKYFTDQRNATIGNIEPFRKEKGSNTMRIFVLGESTTIGYPYFHNGSFHRWLHYRLMHVYPDKQFEIINLSLTAVNSYTVAGFAKEVVDYQPDAVLIYTGHNEYYGALGVGSTDRLGGSVFLVNTMLALRKLRLVQGITNLYEGLASFFRGGKSSSQRTRMEMMVDNQQIPYGSELYTRGVEQFRTNMDKALRLLDEKQIPVFISTVVSNEKDLSPFISIASDSLRSRALEKNYTLGRQAYDSGDLATASRWLNEAVRLDSNYALSNYYLGRISFLQGDAGRAKAWLSRAKELDALRFRAPDQINTIITELSSKYKSVHLVDARAAFEASSAEGIVGNELLLEHVHPNLEGYALLSDVFYNAMKKQGLFPFAPENEMDFRQLRSSMPITLMDSLTGVYKVAKLERSWPFNQSFHGAPDTLKPLTVEEKLAYGIAFNQGRWQDAMDALYDYYSGRQEWEKAGKVLEALILEYPMEQPYYERAANIYGKLNDVENAVFYFRQSFALAPSFDLARKLFVLYLKQDKPADAIPFLDYAIRNNNAGLDLGPVRRLTGEVVELKQKLSRDTANTMILDRIAGDYLRMGNRDGADLYVGKALQKDPVNKEALAVFHQLHSAPEVR